MVFFFSQTTVVDIRVCILYRDQKFQLILNTNSSSFTKIIDVFFFKLNLIETTPSSSYRYFDLALEARDQKKNIGSLQVVKNICVSVNVTYIAK